MMAESMSYVEYGLSEDLQSFIAHNGDVRFHSVELDKEN